MAQTLLGLTGIGFAQVNPRQAKQKNDLTEVYVNARFLTLLSFNFLAVVGTASLSSAQTTTVVPPGNCAAINQAIKALPPGGTVQLQAGTYICHSPIILDKSHVRLIGAGKDLTTIQAADERPMPVIIIGSVNMVLKTKDNEDQFPAGALNGIPYPDRDVTDVVLNDVTVDGNYRSLPDKVVQDRECWNAKTDSSLNCGTDIGFLIRNNGVTIRRANNIRINRIVTLNAFSGGLVLEKMNRDIVVDGLTSYGNWFDGFAGYETYGCLVKNFDIFGHPFSGISVDASYAGNAFMDGVVHDNMDNGVFSADVSHNTYVRVDALNNGNNGYYFDGMTDQKTKKMIPGTCDGNTVIDSKIADSGKRGVMIAHMCRGMSFTNVSVVADNVADCQSFQEDATVTNTHVTCTVQGKTINLDGFY